MDFQPRAPYWGGCLAVNGKALSFGVCHESYEYVGHGTYVPTWYGSCRWYLPRLSGPRVVPCQRDQGTTSTRTACWILRTRIPGACTALHGAGPRSWPWSLRPPVSRQLQSAAGQPCLNSKRRHNTPVRGCNAQPLLMRRLADRPTSRLPFCGGTPRP